MHFFYVECIYLEWSIGILQGLSKRINKNSRKTKCTIHYIWWCVSCWCREWWFFIKLLHKSIALQGLYSLSIFRHSCAILLWFHSGMLFEQLIYLIWLIWTFLKTKKISNLKEFIITDRELYYNCVILIFKYNCVILHHILIWQKLYALGARKIGVPSLVPIGCLPAAITLFGFNSNKCVSGFNNVAIYFNQKLNSTSLDLLKMLPGLNLKVLDTYQLFYDIVSKPSQYGTKSNYSKPN